MRILVTSGYEYNPYAIGIMEALRRRDMPCVACVTVKALQLRRIRKWLSVFSGKEFWWKVRARALRPGDASSEMQKIDAYLLEEGIRSRRTESYCHAHGIEHFSVSSLNSENSIEKVRAVNPDLVLYGGGGILSEKFLEVTKLGTLNAHLGALPHFRGTNTLEWSLVHGVQPAVTIHFVDSGLDTGDIIRVVPLETGQANSLVEIKSRALLVAVTEIARAAKNIKQECFSRTSQRDLYGRRFFRMHPLLVSVLERGLEKAGLNLSDYDKFSYK